METKVHHPTESNTELMNEINKNLHKRGGQKDIFTNSVPGFEAADFRGLTYEELGFKDQSVREYKMERSQREQDFVQNRYMPTFEPADFSGFTWKEIYQMAEVAPSKTTATN